MNRGKRGGCEEGAKRFGWEGDLGGREAEKRFPLAEKEEGGTLDPMNLLMRVTAIGFCAVSWGWAAEANLAGLWKNTAMGISQSAIIISQEGPFLHVAGYGVWADGGAGVWHGKGKIEGARVKLPLTYTQLPKPGFDPKVELDLQISSDAK